MASVNGSAPLHSRRRRALSYAVIITSIITTIKNYPPVSYYAFFKGGCFQAHLLVVITRPLPCTLCHPLGTLTNDLGCFPLDLGSSHPKSVYPSWAGIRSFKGIKDVGPLSKKCSTPELRQYIWTRYSNSFRGKPAISGLVKPFTPNHKSSRHLATCSGSVLHTFLGAFQHAHG
jgi:hypothetical protein